MPAGSMLSVQSLEEETNLHGNIYKCFLSLELQCCCAARICTGKVGQQQHPARSCTAGGFCWLGSNCLMEQGKTQGQLPGTW